MSKKKEAKYTNMQMETSTTVPRDEDQYQNLVKKLTLLCLGLGIFALILFFHKQNNPKPHLNGQGKNDWKYSDESKDMKGLDMLQYTMDTKVDPCVDFYQYACGGWLVKNPTVPNDKSSISKSFTALSEANRAITKDILTDEWPIIGEFYQSCMNTKKLEELGITPLQDMLDKITGATSKKDLFERAGDLSTLGPSFLTSFGISADRHDATTNVLYIGQHGLTLPDRSYYLEEEKITKFKTGYLQFIAKSLETLKMKNTTEYASMIWDFETAIANITVPKEILRDPSNTYHPKTPDELEALAPLAITAYAKGMKMDLHKSPNTNKAYKIVVTTPSFFKALQPIIEKTSLLDLKIVLQYQLMSAFASTLTDDIYSNFFNFFGILLSGQQEMTPRWKRCVDQSMNYLGELVSRYYVLKHFEGQSTAISRALITEIEHAFSGRLETVDWMDAATRYSALQKLSQITNLIGHPDKYTRIPVVLTDSTYFQNKMKLLAVGHKKSMARLGMPVDRTRWFMDAANVNAYYSPSQNQIVFPAGILQSPFFNITYPAAMNFGSIGAVMGHELTHGFDDSGRKFNGEGNMELWWSSGTLLEFKKRTSCLVNQYSNFTMFSDDGKTAIGKVNGNLTLGENIADNGGVHIAYQAFQAHAKTSPKASVNTTASKEMGLSPEQIFFLAWGQTWCKRATDASVQASLTTDVHSPNRWRANGVVMNNVDFAKAYNCPINTPMNPSNKCNLW